MDPIREAFNKIKKEITLIFEEISNLKKEVNLIKLTLNNIKEEFNNSINPTTEFKKQTYQYSNPAHQHIFKALKSQNLSFSTGNEGVPTDRQTDRPTDRQTQKDSVFENLEKISSILDSLDSIKKEIRIKFKRLTNQEFAVFSAIYTLEEEKGYADYKSLSEILNLTPSSIRDYIGRLIEKGIPLQKIKINNKLIHLKISPDLKKITTLSTISKLREL
jgi:DNA-binding MarR family transcriptional regulator